MEAIFLPKLCLPKLNVSRDNVNTKGLFPIPNIFFLAVRATFRLRNIVNSFENI